MNDTFHLQIVTPDGVAFDGDAVSLLVKTDEGDAEFLKGHADYFASLTTGRARVTDKDGKKRFASCQGGFVSVRDGEVKLVAITFEFAEDIDVKRAEAAKEKASEMIANAKDERALKIAKAKFSRAMSRSSVAERLK